MIAASSLLASSLESRLLPVFERRANKTCLRWSPAFSRSSSDEPTKNAFVGVPASAGLRGNKAMATDRPMYQWRQMTPELRGTVLEERKRRSRPWHGPPHYSNADGIYLISAACYQ